MKANKLQQAYLLAKEYAISKRDNESSSLMLIAQENLLEGFLNWAKEYNSTYRKWSAKDIMNFATQETKKSFTELALKADF